MSSSEKQRLRRNLKQQRSALSKVELINASRALLKHARSLPALLNANRVLSYRAINGEIDPQILDQGLPKAEIYLPRILHYSHRRMGFYKANSGITRNQYGIVEPRNIKSPRPAKHFDAILLPLVAFDRNGTRLGMGGGFYDTALQFKLASSRQQSRPLLIGLAHHFQEVKSLDREAWDVPLDVIITDQELIHING